MHGFKACFNAGKLPKLENCQGLEPLHVEKHRGKAPWRTTPEKYCGEPLRSSTEWLKPQTEQNFSSPAKAFPGGAA